MSRGRTIEKQCKNCKGAMTVRIADHNRGWGIFCSKSCKASFQTAKTGVSGPHYKAAGKTVKEMSVGISAKSKIKSKTNARKYSRAPVLCSCGDYATNGVQSITSVTGVEWLCETCMEEHDFSHPFDSEACVVQ